VPQSSLSFRIWLAIAGTVMGVSAQAQPLALVGATAIDVSHGGTETRDLTDAVIVLDEGRIVAIGPRSKVRIPPDAKLLDESGKFVIPGLVDGFCGMQNQAEANAELYEGVTTISASGDDRRGTLFLAADPSPHVYVMDSAGTTDDWSVLRGNPVWRARLADHDHPHELTPEETKAQLTATSVAGSRGIWIGHNITAANARRIIQQGRKLHLVTYGEFVATAYQAGIEAGVSTLLHMSRLELGLARPDLVAAAAADPEGPGADVAYSDAERVAPDDPRVTRYGDLLVAHDVALMPTFSLFYLELPDHRNLWKEPAASILNPANMGAASNPETGERPFDTSQHRADAEGYARRLWALDRAILARHPIVLAASGATWNGTMPGISLHTEMELLVRAGLTPRQALAAATSNYAEHFGWSELGTVAPGRRADLVVLEADPTVDIRNADRILEVFVSGERLDRASLLKRPAQR